MDRCHVTSSVVQAWRKGPIDAATRPCKAPHTFTGENHATCVNFKIVPIEDVLIRPCKDPQRTTCHLCELPNPSSKMYAPSKPTSMRRPSTSSHRVRKDLPSHGRW